MITSTANQQVKNLILLKRKAKARREQRLYVVEGVRMFSEAPVDAIDTVYVSESFLRKHDSESVLAGKGFGRNSGSRFEVLSDTVFDHVSDTETPQGILCLVRMPEYSPEDVFGVKGIPEEATVREDVEESGHAVPETIRSGGGLWLVLEGIQDPGNLGTMFRTAEGAGVTGIVMDSMTADLYNPKTIRSTMGSIWRVPFYITDDLRGMLHEMKARGVRVFAACGGGNIPYTEPDYTGDAAFLIGNEGNGLSERAMGASDVLISIPMRGQLESLNASMAAGILMYEADRQRRQRFTIS